MFMWPCMYIENDLKNVTSWCLMLICYGDLRVECRGVLAGDFEKKHQHFTMWGSEAPGYR